MMTFSMECTVDTDHTVVLRLPQSVAPGFHRIALVVDPAPTPCDPLHMDSPPKFARLAALREQAVQQGIRLMNWDEVNAEVQSRRGGAMDEEDSHLP